MQKDSLGNDLPQSVFLSSSASWEEIGKANTVNTFNLAVGVSIQKGNTVIYDKDRKQATITDEIGFTFVIMHS